MFNEWYLARDDGNMYFDNWVKAWPTELTGVKKTRGCVCYKPTDKSFYTHYSPGDESYSCGLAMNLRAAKKVFGHCPKKGELLCVKKTRSGWKSEKIDLEFS